MSFLPIVEHFLLLDFGSQGVTANKSLQNAVPFKRQMLMSKTKHRPKLPSLLNKSRDKYGGVRAAPSSAKDVCKHNQIRTMYAMMTEQRSTFFFVFISFFSLFSSFLLMFADYDPNLYSLICVRYRSEHSNSIDRYMSKMRKNQVHF